MNDRPYCLFFPLTNKVTNSHQHHRLNVQHHWAIAQHDRSMAMRLTNSCANQGVGPTLNRSQNITI